MNEPVLKKAMNTLEFLSQNEEARRQYEDRQKYLHDEASMYETAKTRGFAEGVAEGKAKGIAEGKAEGKAEGVAEGKAEGEAQAKREIARKLLGLGVDLPVIAEASGLTVEDIKQLKPLQ